MFQGFNLNIDDSFFSNNQPNKNYYKIGKDLYDNNKEQINRNLDDYLGIDGSLDANKICEDWFPNIKSNIFLSHSHNDEDLAIKLSGWLYENFNLKCFIDSCVWGYSNDLLKKIDDKYCSSESTNLYDYNKRNFSTSHIHLMLSTALIRTIDNTECVFFINTPNSVEKTSDIISECTYSPWIYSELQATRLLRTRPISDYRFSPIIEKLAEEYFSNDLKVKYRCSLEHLIDLKISDLNNWQEKYSNYSYLDQSIHALDVLYKVFEK
ncbi:hypothetical protein [Intestinibacter bartlettii]|uniref:hypothetical protein n=1 Tax=Intestinibacter bartlettii TaxID=261299 RepID=UPI00399F4C0C